MWAEILFPKRCGTCNVFSLSFQSTVPADLQHLLSNSFENEQNTESLDKWVVFLKSQIQIQIQILYCINNYHRWNYYDSTTIKQD